METVYSNGVWNGVYADFDYLGTDGWGNTIIYNQVDEGECWIISRG